MELRCSAHTGDPEMDKQLNEGAEISPVEVRDLRGWTPGGVRSEMEKIQAQLSALEADLSAMVTSGAIGYAEVGHELVEASDSLHRAVETLDNNYKSML